MKNTRIWVLRQGLAGSAVEPIVDGLVEAAGHLRQAEDALRRIPPHARDNATAEERAAYREILEQLSGIAEQITGEAIGLVQAATPPKVRVR